MLNAPTILASELKNMSSDPPPPITPNDSTDHLDTRHTNQCAMLQCNIGDNQCAMLQCNIGDTAESIDTLF